MENIKITERLRGVSFSPLLFLAVTVLLLSPMSSTTRYPVAEWPRYSDPPSDAMAGLQFMTAQRAYPLSDLPRSKYNEAFLRAAPGLNLARRMTAGSVQNGYTEPPPWTAIGPKNVGGRTISLAVNPLNADIVFAGAASGGLWRSDTGGFGQRAWHYIDTGYPVLGVNAIAIDPADTANVYIGTGEVYGRDTSIGGLYIRTTRGSYGIGILKSSDGGLTWTKSLDWSYEQQRGVLDIVVDPNDTGTVFAGTSDGVYRSQDGGGTWVNVHDVDMAVDIDINHTNGDTVFASCGNLGIPDTEIGIYRSDDGGDNWQKLNTDGSGLPDTWTGKTLLDLYAASPNVVYADVANALSDDYPTNVALYRSLDSGDTWERLTSGDCCYNPWHTSQQPEYHGYHLIASYQGWFSHFVVVNPVDSSKIIVSGVDTYKSYDGGRTFTRKSKWNAWYGGFIPIGGPEGPAHYSHADHHNFTRHPSLPSRVYLATDGGVFITDDFAESFAGRNGYYQSTQFYAGFSSHPDHSDLAVGGLQDNSSVVYTGFPDWKMVLGGDGGQTGLHASNTSVLIASTQYGNLYKSFNLGDTWTRTNNEMTGDREKVCFVAPFTQSPTVPSIAYAGRESVYRSHDYAEVWAVPGDADPLDNNPVLSISIYAGNPDVVWATTVPDEFHAGVFRSTDGARNWVNVTGELPDRYAVDIVASYHSPDVAYVVYSGFGTPHLYRTTDGGSNWEALGVGQLPDIPTSAFAVDPYNRNYLYLGNDFGVWFSPDDGVTWYPFTTGMPTGALVMDLSISRDNWSVRAVTHGLGVWERTLVSAASAEDDSTAPHFTFGILRNSVLRNYLDLYFAPSEVIPEPPEAEVDSQPIPLEKISTIDGDIYVGDYELSGSGTYMISVSASDFAGNDTTVVYPFEAQLVSGGNGGVLSTADGALRLEVPGGSVATSEYFVAYRLEGEEIPIGFAGKPGNEGNIPLRFLSQEEGPFPAFALVPGDRLLAREALLSLTYDPADLGGEDPASLGIYRWEGGSWNYVESFIDESRNRIEASIGRLGIYRLQLGAEGSTAGALRFGLAQNYPNPFNGSTRIDYTLARTTPVDLHILNVRGQRIRTLVDATEGPGAHSVTWDGRNDSGMTVSTGVYLVVLRTDGITLTRKALFIR